MPSFLFRLFVGGLLLGLAGGPVPASQPEGEIRLIPREMLFGNPDRVQVRLSPDGLHISFLAAHEGVMNVFVAPAEQPEDARPITFEKKRGVRKQYWASNATHILYLQDREGDENWRLYSVDLDGSKPVLLSPFDGSQARVVSLLPQRPHEVLISINNRVPDLHDLYAADVRDGRLELIDICPPGVIGWIVDHDRKVHFAVKFTNKGERDWLGQGDSGRWDVLVQRFPQQDALTSGSLDFTRDGSTLYLHDSRGRNTAALAAYDLSAGKSEILAKNEHADLADIVVNPQSGQVEAVSFNRIRPSWRILNPELKKDFEYLAHVDDGDLRIIDRAIDDHRWLVSYEDDDGPVRFFLYERSEKDNRKAKFLFNHRDALADLPLAPMHPTVIPARDGLELVSYLTLPRGSAKAGHSVPATPLAMVLLVHGGPWARDTWGYNPLHQLLANRGYAVLSVNFRGSTGFGKAFVNAADGQWGGAMHDDLIDAVQWAVDRKIANPDRVAIMGASYGGYATLVGLTKTPEQFACGVDLVGISNLNTFIESVPAYWKPMLALLYDRVGDPRTKEGRQLLEDRSPLTNADKIIRPLLIAQGSNDPRVKRAESDQIVKSLEDKGIPVLYLVYPDEGHGFGRAANRLSYLAVTEAFLSMNLGGRHEPIREAIADSSVQIISGKNLLPGLKSAR